MIINKIIPFFISFILCIDIYGQKPSFIIDSLSGRTEVQKESQYRWQFVRQGQQLYNNDIVRTLPKSHVRLISIDNILLFLNSRTQIQINLVNNLKNSKIYHITVISGEVFARIPPSSSDTIINEGIFFSPSVTFTPNDAAFLLSVKQDKSTELKLLLGTVEIRNKNDLGLTVMSPSFKTTINSISDQQTKYALLQEDIDSLKLWIPPHIIDAILEEQLIIARRNSQILRGKFEDKCIIFRFKNDSEYNRNWNISTGIPRFLSWRLQLSDKKLKPQIIDTIVSDPQSLASLQKTRFFMTGKITFFDIVQHAEISAQADEYRERRIARIKLHLTVTETQSGDKIIDNEFTGEVSGKREQENSWQIVESYPFDLQNESFANSIIGQALSQVLDQVVENIMAKCY